MRAFVWCSGCFISYAICILLSGLERGQVVSVRRRLEDLHRHGQHSGRDGHLRTVLRHDRRVDRYLRHIRVGSANIDWLRLGGSSCNPAITMPKCQQRNLANVHSYFSAREDGTISFDEESSSTIRLSTDQVRPWDSVIYYFIFPLRFPASLLPIFCCMLCLELVNLLSSLRSFFFVETGRRGIGG